MRRQDASDRVEGGSSSVASADPTAVIAATVDEAQRAVSDRAVVVSMVSTSPKPKVSGREVDDEHDTKGGGSDVGAPAHFAVGMGARRRATSSKGGIELARLGASDRTSFRRFDSRNSVGFKSLAAIEWQTRPANKMTAWSCDDLMQRAQRLFLSERRFPDVHLIEPTDCSPYWSNAAAYDVAKQVQQHILSADSMGDFSPIVVFFSTESEIDVSAALTEGLPAKHYSTAVIMPTPHDDDDEYAITCFYVSSLDSCFFPNKVAELLAEGGDSVLDDSVQPLQPLSIQFKNRALHQQSQKHSSGLWSIYNAYMIVASQGDDSYLGAFEKHEAGVSADPIDEFLSQLKPPEVLRVPRKRLDAVVGDPEEIAISATRDKFAELASGLREVAIGKMLFEQQKQLRIGACCGFLPRFYVEPLSRYMLKVHAMKLAVLDLEIEAAKQNFNELVAKQPELLGKFRQLNAQMDMQLKVEEAELAYQKQQQVHVRWNYSEKVFPRATVFVVAILKAMSEFYSSKLTATDAEGLQAVSRPITLSESILLALSLLAVQMVAAGTATRKKNAEAAKVRLDNAKSQLRASITEHGDLLSNMAFMVDVSKDREQEGSLVRGPVSPVASDYDSDVEAATTGAHAASHKRPSATAAAVPSKRRQEVEGFPLGLMRPDGATVVSAIGNSPEGIAFASTYTEYVKGCTKVQKRRLNNVLREQQRQVKVGWWLCCLPYWFVAPLGRKAISAFAEGLAVMNQTTLNTMSGVRHLALLSGADRKKCQAVNYQTRIEISINEARLIEHRRKKKYEQWEGYEKVIPKISVFALTVISACLVYFANNVPNNDPVELLSLKAKFFFIEALLIHSTQFISQTISARAEYHKARLDETQSQLTKMEHDMEASRGVHGDSLIGDLAAMAADREQEEIDQGRSRSAGLALM